MPGADGWTHCAQGHRHWGLAGAAGLLVHRSGPHGLELLLQRRAGWSHHGNTWGIPGGALAYGEQPAGGALREAREELGLEQAAVTLGASYIDDHGGWSYATVLAAPSTCSTHGTSRRTGRVSRSPGYRLTYSWSLSCTPASLRRFPGCCHFSARPHAAALLA